ncbi:MAG: NFACT family protein [Clostridia bacterium]|nr:NFACT family protein [Clostridia bacterium]
MPVDGFLLGFAAEELREALLTGRVDRIQQTDRDTVVLTLRNRNANHKLLICVDPGSARCHLTRRDFTNLPTPPVFCMTLRKHLSGTRLHAIEQINGDRQLHFVFKGYDDMGDPSERTLILEIMGKHSNLILTVSNRILDAMKRVNAQMSRVRRVLPGLDYQYPPAQDKIPYTKAAREDYIAVFSKNTPRVADALRTGIYGLSAQTAAEWAFRLTGDADAPLGLYHKERLADLAPAWVTQALKAAPAALLKDEAGEPLDVFPFVYLTHSAAMQQPYPSLCEAMEAFFTSRDKARLTRQKSGDLYKTIKTHIERCEKKLSLQNAAADEAEKAVEYKKAGDLLMTHLYHLPAGLDKAVLEDVFELNGATIEIKMDPQLSPAQNAQKYYQRYRKARSAAENTREQQEKTKKEIAFLENALYDAECCTQDEELAEVRALLVQAGYIKRSAPHTAKKKQQLPQSRFYTFTSAEGIRILVGKNSTQNDRLTGSANGNEMWLHARAMPGSHVIIQHAGMPPDATLLEAAKLAAYFSKGRHSSGIPIDYTFRKNVKKPGGSAAGFAIYTEQKTLFITLMQGDMARIEHAMGADNCMSQFY